MISNRSFITCLLFCHYWESMKRLQRISAISAKYSGSREIRSSEVLLYPTPYLFCLANDVSISAFFGPDSDLAVFGKGSFAVVHDGSVVVWETTRVDASSIVFVKVVNIKLISSERFFTVN